nr:MAG TPA: hypothetical protein [Bacteriophage sp.]
MFTIIKEKVYLVEKDEMFPVNVSIEKGIQKVGQAQDLPKGYQVYTLREIQVKFNIDIEKPYYFDKEKYEKELAEAKAKKEAEERARMEEEIRAKIEEEIRVEIAQEETEKKAQGKTQGAKTENKNQ